MPIPVVTPQEMSNIDKRAIREYGIPSACLMETAGAVSARKIWEKYGRGGLRVLVVCGKGGNGGDGFAAARHLRNAGADVRAAALFPLDEAAGDSAVFLKALRKMDVPVLEVGEGSAASLEERAKDADVIVDAILGTGFRPPARGLPAEAIRVLAACGAPVAAIDVPSGLDAGTGEAGLPHVAADLTLALGALKRGHLLMPAAARVGELVKLDIGIPQKCVDEEEAALRVTEPSDAARNLPRRAPDAHKGDAGHLFVLGGAPGMSGAALLTSMAALRAGAGRVTLCAPESIRPLVEGRHPEVMTLSLPATEAGSAAPAAFDLILERSEDMSALVAGPGLTTNPRTVELVHRLVQHVDAPLALAGFSLGGSVLLRWLGERGEGVSPRVRGAVCVSASFQPGVCARALDSPAGWLYRRHLLGSAKRKAREFSERHPGLIEAEAARRARTFHEFDRAVIAPLYGFRDELDYYEKADCSPWLSRVRVKTLLLASEDDPIVPARVFPREEIEKSPWLTGVLSKRGGHVGFVSGRSVRSPGYWAEERAFAFLRERLAPGG